MEINFNSSKNIFLSAKNAPIVHSEATSSGMQPVIRLNDFDGNILEQKAYGDLQDKMLKLECRIENAEDMLSKILDEIKVSQDLGETAELDILNMKKNQIEAELMALNKQYSELDLSSRLSGQIASLVAKPRRKRISFTSKIGDFLSENVFSKISKRFGFVQHLKNSLEKLSRINSSVDELITMKSPHGEAKERYRKLTSYINRANVIQFNITKTVSEFK